MKWTVDEKSDGMRLDVYLSEILSITRSAAQKHISDGFATVDGKILTKNHRVKINENITVCEIEVKPTNILPQDIPLCIIYEDDDLIVVDKPQGMVVHPAAGNFDGTLVNALLFYCKGSLSGIGGVERPGIVHRLDKDTSGLLVVAKNDHAHLHLSEQLATRKMGRVYNAICTGHIKNDTLRINQPIGRCSHDRKKMAVQTREKQGKFRDAVTNISVLERNETARAKFTLIEAKLETGRTHQIRVHLAFIGHPVLGDMVYGNEKQPFGLTAQILHAAKLRLTHPTSGEVMEFTSSLPKYFTDVYAKAWVNI